MSCDRRRADPSTQLDVDVLILDFLCYSATKELLKQAHKTRDSPQADKTLHLAGGKSGQPCCPSLTDLQH